MAPRRNPTRPLGTFYDVKQATVRLGIATEDPEDTTGQRMLRDGVNREHNPFPHHRIGRKLMFSETDLAIIAEMRANPGRYRKRATTPRKRHAAGQPATGLAPAA